MRAAVVGCGVAGMASALALARRGHEVTLLECFDSPRPLGSGLLLQPSGLAALRVLGLDQAMLAAGARIDRLDGRDLAGRRILGELAEHRRDEAGRAHGKAQQILRRGRQAVHEAPPFLRW